jgi:hypothetical protein
MALIPVCLVIVWIGAQPKFVLDRLGPAVDQLAGPAMRATDESTVRFVGIPDANGQELTQRRKGAKAQADSAGTMNEGVDRFSRSRSLIKFNSPQRLSHPDPSFLCAFAPLRETTSGQAVSRPARSPDYTWYSETTEPARVP